MAVHASNLTNVDMRLVRLRFHRVTIAMTVVTGVTKRNQSVNSSAKFSGNQWGMRRSIGNAIKNAKNPNKAGKHHRSDTQISLWCKDGSSKFVTRIFLN